MNRLVVAAPVRVAIVTNIPAPYRLRVYELLAEVAGIEPALVFCSGLEPDRRWKLERLNAAHLFLRERIVTWRGRFIHLNPDVLGALRALQPAVVVTTGFNPTHLLAYAYARRHGLKHVAMTDGTATSEASLTALHRWIRRRVYATTSTFIGASAGSFSLYRQYGIPESAIYRSPLCANNSAFTAPPFGERDVDFIFCGRFVASKLPLFALEVAQSVARRLGRRVRMLLVGSGELEAMMRDAADAASDDIDAQFTGFAQQAELPALYARAKVALFPTRFDPWGVVANEACAAGVPVLTSPQAGAAHELVRDGDNGHVLPLDLNAWTDAASALLTDWARWQSYSARCVELVQNYTYDHAARGLADAILAAASRGKKALQ